MVSLCKENSQPRLESLCESKPGRDWTFQNCASLLIWNYVSVLVKRILSTACLWRYALSLFTLWDWVFEKTKKGWLDVWVVCEKTTRVEFATIYSRDSSQECFGFWEAGLCDSNTYNVRHEDRMKRCLTFAANYKSDNRKTCCVCVGEDMRILVINKELAHDLTLKRIGNIRHSRELEKPSSWFLISSV